MPSTAKRVKRGALNGAMMGFSLYNQTMSFFPRSIQNNKYVKVAMALPVGLGMAIGALQGVVSDQLLPSELEEQERLKQQKQEQINYAIKTRKENINNVLVSLDHHAEALANQDSNGRLKAAILQKVRDDLQKMSDQLHENINSFVEFDNTSDRLKINFKDIIDHHLGNENDILKAHRSWATKIAIFIINTLMVATVVPLLVHKATNHSWFFRPKTNTTNKLEKAEENLKVILDVKINGPAPAA